MPDLTQNLQASVVQAYQDKTLLNIMGGDTKSWYGREVVGEPLNLSEHEGILSY